MYYNDSLSLVCLGSVNMWKCACFVIVQVDDLLPCAASIYK